MRVRSDRSGTGGASGTTRGGSCPNLLQRRSTARSAGRRTAEYQRFSSRAPTRSGPLQQIWTNFHPDASGDVTLNHPLRPSSIMRPAGPTGAGVRQTRCVRKARTRPAGSTGVGIRGAVRPVGRPIVECSDPRPARARRSDRPMDPARAPEASARAGPAVRLDGAPELCHCINAVTQMLRPGIRHCAHEHHPSIHPGRLHAGR